MNDLKHRSRIHTNTRQVLQELLNTSTFGIGLSHPRSVAFVGASNVGKSSITNMLVGSDRSLVHHEPGTTRDAVSSVVSLSGIPLRLIDTAGLRASANEIESAGISISLKKLRSADLVVWVFDNTRPLDPFEASHLQLLAGKRLVCVINKIDLPSNLPEPLLSARLSSTPIHTCALSGKGRREFEQRILTELFGPHLPEVGAPLIFTEELRDLVSRLCGGSPPFDELAALLEPL